jgi:hypothetical protein
MHTKLSIDIVGTRYSPVWLPGGLTGCSVSNFVSTSWAGVEVPEPYQDGQCPFGAYPTYLWAVDEMDLYYRDRHHDGLV